MTHRVIDVQIGALIMHGFPAGEQRAIAEAFQSALAAALSTVAERGELPASLVRNSVARELDAGNFQIARGASSSAIAAGAAASLASGLSRGSWR